MDDPGAVERRDLVTLVVNGVGAVVATDVLWEPYRLVDSGQANLPVGGHFISLLADS